MSSPFDLRTQDGRESEYRRILRRLQRAIQQELGGRLGDEAEQFLHGGESDPEGEWAQGVWADVDLPSARLLDAGERFVQGDVERDRLIALAEQVLDAWKQSIDAAAAAPERERSRRR